MDPRRLRVDELLYAAIGDRCTPMQIALLGVFEGGPFRRTDGTPDLERIRGELARRAERLPELRRRVLRTRPGEGRPLWVPDPGFVPLHHVLTTTLPPGAQLPDWAANRAARAVEPDRPPWRAEVVGGLPAGRFAVLIVVSHVLADGLAGVTLAGALLDPDPGGPAPAAPEAAAPPLPTHRALVRRRLGELAAAVRRTGRRRAAPGDRPPPRLRDVREAMAGFAGPEPATPLPRRIGPGRRMVVVRRPLEEVERAGHALGVTVNDLLLAAVAAGLRTLLADRGEVAPGTVLRCTVPVATAGSGRQVMAVLVVGLPVGEPDPLRRLAAVHRATAAGKERLRAAGSDATDLPLPLPLVRWVVRTTRRLGSRRLTLAVTDVPGPRSPLWLAGARLLAAVPIAPMAPDVPLSVAALSYAGELAVSVNADAAATGLDVLADGIARGFTELLERARTTLLPFPPPPAPTAP